MTIDVTSLAGITRPQSNSEVTNRGAAKVVAINIAVSEKLTQESQQAAISDVKDAAKKVNEFVQQLDRNLEFSVDESSGRVIITVREPETGKIIRQIHRFN